MAEVELPYRAEYAKSARASCKTCKEKIDKEVLRIAAMVQSPMFDGKVPNWYHYKCFFVKQRPTSVTDIAHFDQLRYDDQEKIKESVEKATSSGAPAKGRGGKGKSKASASAAAGGAKEFSVEVAKSGRAGCQGCESKILKGEIRISKMDYSSDSARRYGPMPRWHHTDCFLELREELQWYGPAKELPGFYATPADIQDQLAGKIKQIKRKAEDTVDSVPVKKVKREDQELHKKQNEAMFKFRDNLKKLAKKELIELIEHNAPNFAGTGLGESLMLDRLSDYMTFGMILPCSVCKDGFLVFKSGSGYQCTGHATAYTRCTHLELAPKRKPFVVPQELAQEYSFMKKYKQPSLGDRYFVVQGPSAGVLASAVKEHTGPRTQAPKLPALAGLSFVVPMGTVFSGGQGTANIITSITKLGGDVTKTVTKTTAAVLTTTEMLAAGEDKAIKKAENLGIQCVGEDFLEEVKEAKEGGALLLIRKKAISDWGEDPEERVSSSKLYSKTHKSGKSGSGKRESKFTKSVPDKLKMQLKDGGAVDPDSGISESAHVLSYGGKRYSSVLGNVDIVKGTNSYYKLQLLESDNKNAWWVFRSWGRIGTTIGGNKLEDMQDKHDAMREYHTIFEEKTGNTFTASSYTKVAGRWTLLDIDYGEETAMQKLTVSETSSKLALSVQELIALIFDVDTMKSQMLEFEIDLKKLPLGKLSSKQLTSAYTVLAEAQELLQEDVKTNGTRILDCSNRFYTLIPHDFGMNKVPLLDNLELIKSKIEMVESLSEIEVAYSLMKQEAGKEEEGSSPIDAHYSKLNTVIQEIDAKSDEYKVLQKYVQNTHASTHSYYTLKIANAFRIERKGEAKRFKPFKKLPNHKLLWHGSRLTNFVGILSQGLRIAPPEAPATGYMFGKGVYFADMVSKSANYCNTSSNNPTGLMMLCDVALGNMYELEMSKYVTKLESGKHSTKGCGRTYPDPSDTTTLDGVEVPYGKPTTDGAKNSSSLLYNEFIVYDVGQIQAKYLLKMDFQYTSAW